MAINQNHEPTPETPIEHPDPMRDDHADQSEVLFAVRRFRDANEIRAVPDIDLATAFAESNNTLHLDRLRKRLHPKVVYESDWAGVSMVGRRRVIRWLRSKYAFAADWGGYRAQVVVLAYGRAGVLTTSTSIDQQALTTFDAVDGLAIRMSVTSRVDRQSLRETLYYPPEA